MQQYPPNKVLTSQQTSFPYEPITITSRFRRLPEKVQTEAIEQLDYRRERQVYLLTNGQRNIGQIANLLGMPPVDIAYMMKQLLEKSYVELLPAVDLPR